MLMRVEGLSKQFGGLRAVDNVDFSINEGEILGVIGPNGSGKTTLINMITGIYPPTSGRIYFNDLDISKLSAFQVVEKGITRTFQGIRIFNNITVIDSVLTAMHTRSKASFWGALVGSTANKKQELASLNKAEELLRFTGIYNSKEKLGGDLPLRDQQSLAIAIALATDPKLVFLDEPTAGLVTHEKDEFLDLFRQIRDKGVTLVIVEHDMRLIMKLCERLIVLNYGRKISEGMPRKVCDDTEVQKAYLGCEFTNQKT